MPKRKGLAAVSVGSSFIVVACHGVLQFRLLQHLPLRQLALQEGSRSVHHQLRRHLVALEPVHLLVLLLRLPLRLLEGSPSASLLRVMLSHPHPRLPLPRRLLSVDSLSERSQRTRRKTHRRRHPLLRPPSRRSADSRLDRRMASHQLRPPRLLLRRQPSLLPLVPRPLPRSHSVDSRSVRQRRHRLRLSEYRRQRGLPPLFPRPPSRALPQALAHPSRSLLTRVRCPTTPRSVA